MTTNDDDTTKINTGANTETETSEDGDSRETATSEADRLPTAPVEVGGQFALMLSSRPDRIGFRSVAVADVPGLMAAYRSACRLARDTETLVNDAGFGKDLLGVVALVDDTGRPAIQVLLTVAGTRRLAQLFNTGSRPPPRRKVA